MVLYWAGAELYLIDPSKADLGLWSAILISALSLGVGWIIFMTPCVNALADYPTGLMVLLFGLLVLMAWGYDQVFTGRRTCAFGGNYGNDNDGKCLFIIMPNQRIVVADLGAGHGRRKELAKSPSSDQRITTI